MFHDIMVRIISTSHFTTKFPHETARAIPAMVDYAGANWHQALDLFSPGELVRAYVDMALAVLQRMRETVRS